MAILPLVVAPDKRLFICSSKVEKVDSQIRKLFDDMLETMHYNQGIGLAAVQVGEHKRMLIVHLQANNERYEIDVTDDANLAYKEPLFVCNPEITYFSEEKSDYLEGCLSFPGEKAKVTRSQKIKMQYLDYHGHEQEIIADGLLATCLQHEIDHTNGIVFADRIAKIKREKIMTRMRKRLKKSVLP